MANKRNKQPRALAVFSSYGLLLFLCVYPLFLQNKYFKMTIGKTVFFYCAAAIFTVGCLICSLISQSSISARLKKATETDLFLGLFLFTAVISCAASPYRQEAFTGENGRYMGLFTLLMIGCAFFFIARFGRITRPAALIFGCSMIFMNAVALLQYRGLDPFGLYRNTADTVRVNFMSLVGNKDVYYSYLALTVPFAMYLCHTSEDQKERIFWHAASFFGFAGALACNSEGVFIALAPAFLILFFTNCREREGLLCWLRHAVVFFGAALLVALIKPDLTEFGITETLVTRLLRPLPCLGALAAAGLIYLIAWKCPLSAGFLRGLRIAAACVCGIGAAGLIGAFVYFTFFDRATDLGSLKEFLRFDDVAWGNKRGYVWSRLFGLYRDFPLFRKLIGNGEETVEMLMQTNFGSEMVAKTGMNFDNAHNEFLQYLVTQGALGLITYLLLAGSAVRSGFKNGGAFQKAAALCCVCYLAQSAVNISQAITTPLFFVMLALTQTADPDTLPPTSETTKKRRQTGRKTKIA